jgi:uncharacterized HAD superfamily protein
MKIGIDMDGVVTDFVTPFSKMLRTMTGVELEPMSATYPTTWNYHLDAGVTKSQADAVWDLIKSSPTFWARMNPLPGVWIDLEKVERASYEGHEVHYITSRPGIDVQRQTARWLVGQNIFAPSVIVADNARHKGEIAAALRLDAFIDDNVDNAKSVLHHSPRTQTFIKDQPYNRESLPVEIIRVKNLVEMLEHIGVLSPIGGVARVAA